VPCLTMSWRDGCCMIPPLYPLYVMLFMVINCWQQRSES
jgi:hypothetical protein